MVLKTAFVKIVEKLPVNVEEPKLYTGIKKTVVFQRDDEETVPGTDISSIRDGENNNILFAMESNTLLSATTFNWQNEDMSFSSKITDPVIHVQAADWNAALVALSFA